MAFLWKRWARREKGEKGDVRSGEKRSRQIKRQRKQNDQLTGWMNEKRKNYATQIMIRGPWYMT